MIIKEIDGILVRYPEGYPPYGNLSDEYKNISVSIEPIRKLGCTWRINGEQCKKPCDPFILYCQEHKNISDIKRVIHEPLTTCRKRK
jgi:hypothetical protein